MSTDESLDVLSEVLLEDERIVSADTREFLTDLLRRSESYPDESQPELTRAIARIAGEIAVRRAGSLVGDSFLRKLVKQNLLSGDPRGEGSSSQRRIQQPASSLPPKPPAPAPPAPGPKAYDSNHSDFVGTANGLPPHPPTPAPPGPGRAPGTAGPKGILNPAEYAELLPPRCIVLDEFLAPAEMNELMAYTIAHENDFIVSEVIFPGATARSAVDFEYRRSHVLMDTGPHHQNIVNRMRLTLPRVLPRLGMDSFPISRVETQITASGNGDFFRWHSDNAQHEVAVRQLTFVYFFHHEPKAFEGGELHIQSSSSNDPANGSENYYTIVPGQNQVVLFDSSLTHEIAPVRCLSGKFADSRFTLNGWFCR